MKTISIIIGIFLFANIANAQWTLVADSINYEDEWHYSARKGRTHISSDGTTVAVGALYMSGSPLYNYQGRVRVFEISGGIWQQKGSNIDNPLDDYNDHFSESLKLSEDGNTIIIGASGFDTDSYSSSDDEQGQVKIFQYNGSDWIQKGSTILSDIDRYNLGYSVDISSDGNSVAISYKNYYYSSEGNKGIKVYDYISGDWQQKGSNIIGADHYRNVCLNQDGTIVASTNLESTKIYEYDGTNWLQIGTDIEVISSSESQSISLNAIGNTIVIGNPLYTSSKGRVKVYENIAGNWTLKGNIIDESAPYSSYFGSDVDISNDGNTIAVSIRESNDENLIGDLRVYTYESGIWELVGNQINGNLQEDWMSVSITGDGTRVAAGYERTPPNYSGRGRVKVFEFLETPAEILSQSNNIDVCENENTFLYITDNNTVETYQWRKNGIDISNTNNDTLYFNNITLTSAGNYSCYVSNDYGNDLSNIIELIINPSYEIIDTVRICQETNFFWEGSLYDQSGTYYFTYNLPTGCDSTRILELEVLANYDNTSEYDSVCIGDSIEWHNQFYSTSGLHYDTTHVYQSGYGYYCSCFELNLTLNPNPSSFAITGQTTVDELETIIYSVPENTDVTYNWMATGGNVISNTPNNVANIQWGIMGNGEISVISENQYNCFSAESILQVAIGNVSVNFVNNRNEIEIYPNPASDFVNIKSLTINEINIYNSIGKLILTKEISNNSKVDISNLKEGVYFIKSSDNNTSIRYKLIIK